MRSPEILRQNIQRLRLVGFITENPGRITISDKLEPEYWEKKAEQLKEQKKQENND